MLRRNGISTLGNIITTPLPVLKRIGLTGKEFLELKLQIPICNIFGEFQVL